jgi:hypothetical protein
MDLVDPLFAESFGSSGKYVRISTADLFSDHGAFSLADLPDVVWISRSSTRKFKPRKV